MSLSRQTIMSAAASFALGVGAAVALFYFLGIPYLSRFWVYSAYQHSASDGLVAVSVLRHLRRGETEHAISILEATLDADLLTLAYYPDTGDSAPVDVRFPGPVSAFRDYRREFPSPQTDLDTRAVLNRVLTHEATRK